MVVGGVWCGATGLQLLRCLVVSQVLPVTSRPPDPPLQRHLPRIIGGINFLLKVTLAVNESGLPYGKGPFTVLTDLCLYSKNEADDR